MTQAVYGMRVRLFRVADGFRWTLVEPQDSTPILVSDVRRTAEGALASLCSARACAAEIGCYQLAPTGFALVDETGIILAGRGGFRDTPARDDAISLVRATLPDAPLDEGEPPR